MPALDDIRALRASRDWINPVSRPAENDDEDELRDDDPSVQESGALAPEDEALAASVSTLPFAGDAPAPARWEEEAAPEVAVWSTKKQEALKPLWTQTSDDDAEAFCVRFSSDDTLLAAGCGDGVVRVFHVDGGRLAYRLEACAAGLPTTALRFRPASAASKTRNVLVVANSDGTLQHWHITSSRCLHTVTEEGNQILALDYQADGSRFATAGKDYTVRVYDEATKTCVSKLCGGWAKTQGHSNRIFSVKFSTADPNVLVSAGWDNTVQVWDLRTETAVRSIYGPHVCGDAIDLDGSTLLTGSWRPNHQLQMWNISSGELMENVPWRPHGEAKDEEACMLYAAQFCKHSGNDLLAAAGTGAGELKVFSRSQKSVVGYMGCPNGVYGLDFSNHGRFLAIAGGDSSVRVVQVPR